MAIEIKLAEFTVPKKTQYGTVQRSTGQDYVWVMNPDTKSWVHCGYLAHKTAERTHYWFCPLVNVPTELVAEIVAECSKQKKEPVMSAGSVYEAEIVQSEDEYDELEG
jgi:hypothetical protein